MLGSQIGAMAQLFGPKLRALRLARGMTQAALAEALGLATQSSISHLEAGRKEPSVSMVVQLADLFGVSLDYLLRDTAPPLDPPAESSGP